MTAGEPVAVVVEPAPWLKPRGPYSSSKLMLPVPAVQLTVTLLSATVVLTPVGASQGMVPSWVVALVPTQFSLVQSSPQTAFT